MNKSFSVYLDFIRFFAAFVVFVFHSRDILDIHLPFANYGHEAVVVFFILSGYVISYVSREKEKNLKAFAVSRITRIYSVALPAIIITRALDWIGFAINQAPYAAGKRAWDHFFIRVGSGLLFLGEIWKTSIQLFSNVPYWSLNYEVWYYAGFAVLTYAGGAKRWLAFAALCLFLGPKILLLMPIWWAGVFLQRIRPHQAVPMALGIPSLLLSLIGFWCYQHYSMGHLGVRFHKFLMESGMPMSLDYSEKFLTDYFFGIAVACHFLGMRAVCERFPDIFVGAEKPIRAVASATFTLYLLHQPFLLFFHALYFSAAISTGRYALILLSSFAAIMVLNALIEKNKFRLKRLVSQGVEMAHAKARAYFPAA